MKRLRKIKVPPAPCTSPTSFQYASTDNAPRACTSPGDSGLPAINLRCLNISIDCAIMADTSSNCGGLRREELCVSRHARPLGIHDYTNPRSWYHSRTKQQLIREFTRDYNLSKQQQNCSDFTYYITLPSIKPNSEEKAFRQNTNELADSTQDEAFITSLPPLLKRTEHSSGEKMTSIEIKLPELNSKAGSGKKNEENINTGFIDTNHADDINHEPHLPSVLGPTDTVKCSQKTKNHSSNPKYSLNQYHFPAAFSNSHTRKVQTDLKHSLKNGTLPLSTETIEKYNELRTRGPSIGEDKWNINKEIHRLSSKSTLKVKLDYMDKIEKTPKHMIDSYKRTVTTAVKSLHSNTLPGESELNTEHKVKEKQLPVHNTELVIAAQPWPIVGKQVQNNSENTGKENGSTNSVSDSGSKSIKEKENRYVYNASEYGYVNRVSQSDCAKTNIVTLNIDQGVTIGANAATEKVVVLPRISEDETTPSSSYPHELEEDDHFPSRQGKSTNKENGNILTVSINTNNMHGPYTRKGRPPINYVRNKPQIKQVLMGIRTINVFGEQEQCGHDPRESKVLRDVGKKIVLPVTRPPLYKLDLKHYPPVRSEFSSQYDTTNPCCRPVDKEDISPDLVSFQTQTEDEDGTQIDVQSYLERVDHLMNGNRLIKRTEPSHSSSRIATLSGGSEGQMLVSGLTSSVSND